MQQTPRPWPFFLCLYPVLIQACQLAAEGRALVLAHLGDACEDHVWGVSGVQGNTPPKAHVLGMCLALAPPVTALNVQVHLQF